MTDQSQSHNPAAERPEQIPGWMAEEEGGNFYRVDEADAWLDAALLHERRATVERTGIRITAQQIRDALHALGHTGTAAEAFVRSAAGAMADILDATASEEEARPADRHAHRYGDVWEECDEAHGEARP